MPVSLARRIAFDVLRRVSAEGAYASELLYVQLGSKARGQSAKRIGRADAALATELTMGVLRWQRLLDFWLDGYLDSKPSNDKTPSARLDLEVLLALRLGIYQLRLLERVPAHAAVGESVE